MSLFLENIPAAGAMKTAFVVLVIILVVVLGLLLIMAAYIQQTGRDARTGGCEKAGGAAAPPRHDLGLALYHVRKGHTHEHVVSPPPLLNKTPYDVSNVTIGGAKKARAPRRHWTEYDTWEALHDDPAATRQYWTDSLRAINKLDLDWSGVRAELGDKLYDNREWAGRINIVDGKPKIVELRPSPYAVGEGPLPKGAAAMVPAELMAEIEAKPALFVFHTHPGEEANATMPSTADLAGALHGALTGRFAADLIISPYATLLYAPNPAFRADVWASGDAQKANLATLRKVADVLGAFDGTRSWSSPWTLSEFAEMLARYNIEYVVFPTYKYARVDRRQVYATPDDASDPELVQYYQEEIANLEKEAERARVTSASHGLRGKQVRILQ